MCLSAVTATKRTTGAWGDGAIYRYGRTSRLGKHVAPQSASYGACRKGKCGAGQWNLPTACELQTETEAQMAKALRRPRRTGGAYHGKWLRSRDQPTTAHGPNQVPPNAISVHKIVSEHSHAHCLQTVYGYNDGLPAIKLKTRIIWSSRVGWPLLYGIVWGRVAGIYEERTFSILEGGRDLKYLPTLSLNQCTSVFRNTGCRSARGNSFSRSYKYRFWSNAHVCILAPT